MAFVNLHEKEIHRKERGIPILPMATPEKYLNSKLKKTSFPSSAVLGTNVTKTLKQIIALTVTTYKTI